MLRSNQLCPFLLDLAELGDVLAGSDQPDRPALLVADDSPTAAQDTDESIAAHDAFLEA